MEIVGSWKSGNERFCVELCGSIVSCVFNAYRPFCRGRCHSYAHVHGPLPSSQCLRFLRFFLSVCLFSVVLVLCSTLPPLLFFCLIVTCNYKKIKTRKRREGKKKTAIIGYSCTLSIVRLFLFQSVGSCGCRWFWLFPLFSSSSLFRCERKKRTFNVRESITSWVHMGERAKTHSNWYIHI